MPKSKQSKSKQSKSKHHLLEMTQAERKAMKKRDPVYYAQMLAGAVADAFKGENNDNARKKRIDKGYGIKAKKYVSGGEVKHSDKCRGGGKATRGLNFTVK